jgi:hypothetical protein
MKQILITIAAVLLMGCGESKELVKLEGFIVNKKLYFTLNSDENEKLLSSFSDKGICQNSARPKGEYDVKGSQINIEDAEKVRLVFDKHKIPKGDSFEAYSESQPTALIFNIDKIEELKAEGK